MERSEVADVDVFLLVYSVTDRQSFAYVQQCLQDAARVRRTGTGLVVVANKYDLVRNRVVSTAGPYDYSTLAGSTVRGGRLRPRLYDTTGCPTG